jgi:hypothetical protein
MATANTEQLMDCLASTRDAILAGRLELLGPLAERLEAALTADVRPPSAVLHRIRAAAEENGRLLEAALKGVRAAKRRALDLTETGRFSTYAQGGQRHQPGLPTTRQSIRV